MSEQAAPEPLALLAGPDARGVAVITLNRPRQRNALSIALRDQVTSLLGQLSADEAVKALVIAGRGGSFSAGFDLREFAVTDERHQERLWRSADRFHQAVHRFPLPVIAAVDGPAYGGGFDLAVLCDLRVATPRAVFGHPEAAHGPVVYGPLHDLLGGALARELVLLGREVTAAEALRLHLVSELTGPAALPGRALDLAAAAARAPRAALVRNKAKFIARAAIAPRTATLDL
jgi:enoyl-CoA hydratase/carnithine racemase